MAEVDKDFLAALDEQTTTKVGDVVKAEVLSIENGQIIVGLGSNGEEAAVPARELSNGSETDLHQIVKVGDQLDLVITRQVFSDKEGVSFLASRNKLAARKAWENLNVKVGDVVDVPVVTVVRGGLIVDVDGARGFVPASLIDDHFVSNLQQFKGQTIKAKITEIDPAESRMVLSRRDVVAQAHVEQLNEALGSLSVGDVIEAPVTRLADFGAFVQVAPEVDGLVHVSEISEQRVSKPSDVLKVGETVKVRIIGIDKEKGRISLSIRQAMPNVWDDVENKYAAGDVVTGTVKNLTDFGAFVEVEPGLEGLVHISEIDNKRVAKPSDVLKVGETVQAKVLDIQPEKRRLSLSIKALSNQSANDEGVDQSEEN